MKNGTVWWFKVLTVLGAFAEDQGLILSTHGK